MTTNKSGIPPYKVITICGSMKFYPAMLLTAKDLSLKGYIVLMPFVVFSEEEQHSLDKEMLDKMHFAKIDMSHEICVVTNTEGYIGNSTRREMAHALTRNKMMHVHEYREPYSDNDWELVGVSNPQPVDSIHKAAHVY